VASTYETMSKEEANSFLFGGQPQEQMAPPQVAPAETAPRKTKPIAPPVMGKPVAGELNSQGLVQQVTQANKAVQAQTPAPQAPSAVGALIDQVVNNWALPALGLGALAVAGYAGYKSGANTGSSAKEGLKSRDITQRIEPTMDGSDLSKPTPTAVPVPKEETQTKFAKDFEIKYGVPLATAEEISGGKITKQWEADIVGNAIKNNLPITVKKEAPIIASTTTTQPATMANPIDSQPLKSQFDTSKLGQPFDVTKLGESRDPLANRGFQYPVVPTTEPTSVATGNTGKAVQAIVAKELDKTSGMYRDAQGNMVYPEKMSPAARAGYEAFAKQYPDIAKKLEAQGQMAILGGGSGDNSLNNSYNSDLAKKIRNEILGGKMVGTHGGEGGFYNATVTPAIKAISPTTELGKEIAQLPEKGGTHGNLGVPATIGGAKGGLMKAPNQVRDIIKAGGPALLLMSMADAAKAAQKGNYGEAAVRTADVATDYIPGVAQLKRGFTPTEAGGPGLSKQAVENAYKLGSPYAQSEEAKKARLKEKAGAGRGIAPPSAYMR
jgi:hypothetical protein